MGDTMKERSTDGKGWQQVLIFPEGTCTNRTALITFRLGAFIPGVPVQPVILRYDNCYDTVTWTWEGIPAWKAIVYSLSQLLSTRKQSDLLALRFDIQSNSQDLKC